MSLLRKLANGLALPKPEPKPPPAAPKQEKVATLQVRDGFDGGRTKPTGDTKTGDLLRDVGASGGRVKVPGDAKGGVQPAPVKVPPKALEALPAEERKAVEEAASGKGTAAAHAKLTTVTGAPGFEKLSPEVQAEFLTRAVDPKTTTSSTGTLEQLAESENFRAMSPKDQARVLELHDGLDAGGREQLVALTNRTVDNVTLPASCGKGTALLSVDSQGKTLLDNLTELSTMKLDPKLASEGIQRADLLESVMEECATPGQINQANRGTCTVTSMQYMLCTEQPGEYARLMTGLLSPEGKATLRNGDPLVRVSDSIAKDSATNRSDSERIFQSAMMDYANGDENYSNVDDASTKERWWILPDVDHGGLYPDQEERGLEALFGQDYKRVKGGGLEYLESVTPGQTLVDFKWGDGGHAVVVERVEDGRVYFRNPWGPTTDATGTTYSDPDRRMEDPANRVESMTVEEFNKKMRTVYVPN